MVDQSQILSKLALVRGRELSAWDFHRWIESASWDVEEASARKLIGEIQSHFEDYYQSDLEESDLVGRLSDIANPAFEFSNLEVSLSQNALPLRDLWVGYANAVNGIASFSHKSGFSVFSSSPVTQIIRPSAVGGLALPATP